MFKGFVEGVCYNFCAALNATYYQQLYRPIFKFKGLTPRQYIVELEAKWVFLDERQIKFMKDHYFRGWESSEEHITKFSIRLNWSRRTYSGVTSISTTSTKIYTTCQ